MRILVSGIGGIGGVLAGEMIRAGHAPALVTGNREIAEAITARGLRVKTPAGAFTVRATAVVAPSDLPDGSRFDAAFLLTKATSVVEAARATVPVLARDGFVVALQNGMVEDAVGEAIGRDRVVSGIVGWGGTMHGPGSYERTGPGSIHLGELDGTVTDRARAIVPLLEAASPVVVTTNILGALWSKLAINCTITTIGAIAGETLGAMLGVPAARRVFLETYREVVDTAEAHGVRLERIAANPRTLYLPKGAGPFTRFTKDLLARIVGRKYRKLRSSMLQSVERGRPTEIDFLNGYVVGKAREKGLAVPMNEALVRLVKEIESGCRKPCMQNLADLHLCRVARMPRLSIGDR